MKVQGGPPDWIGSTIAFELKNDSDVTILLFKHDGWAAVTESMHHCSTKWAVFLLSLRDYREKGRGQPSPHDNKIDNWN